MKNFLLISALFLSTFSWAQTLNNTTLARQDFKNTSNNTVTVTTYEKNGLTYVYAGGDGAHIDVYQLDKEGLLNPISQHKLSNDRGPARGLVADHINGTDFLFVGNKGGNAVEVYKILENGALERTFILNDTDETFLGVVITLQVIHMKDASYLFVGGLEKYPGLSSFKIQEDGKLTHVQSIKDDDSIHTDGIIGMFTHKLEGKTFLYTGGFQDNGISSFRIYEDGTFKFINSISDNETNRYLTGTYPVTGVELGGNYYVIVGHRHHKYYKRGASFIKNPDFVYHGDGVTVFKINNKGALVPHFTLVDDEHTKLAGQTRIEVLSVNNNEAIVAVATRDDQSIQLCKLDQSGTLTALSYLETGFPIYYGMGAAKIDNELFFIAGAVNSAVKKLVSYKVNTQRTSKTGKVLRHIVNLTYKEDATTAEIEKAVNLFANLKNEISAIAGLEWGKNDSTEGHSKGFTHCFTLTFNDEHSREIYLFHPAHLALVKKVGPILADVMVMDYWVKE
ncbi:MAG: Dabb family protein [Bacteroidota bacterium]